MTGARTTETIHLLPGGSRRLRRGHPWIYSNEIRMDEAARALSPGTFVRVCEASGEPLGIASFNPHTLIAARLFGRDPDLAIDAEFLAERLRTALALREALYEEPCYRLIHSEADGLPGVVVDRYGDALACQLNTAGAERLAEALVTALDAVLAPRIVVLRGDAPVRALEGLPETVRTAKGALEGPVELGEEGVRFLADLEAGQKTGWYFDQRDNRSFLARLARGRRILDVYCHSGGFALRAAAAGARSVLGLDSSELALGLAGRAAALNGLAGLCRFERAKAFAALERLGAERAKFDVVACDPPSFVKSRKELKAGLRAYRKLARLAAGLVAANGDLLLASCSHNVERADFLDAVRAGLLDAGRTGRILRDAGAGPDHPVHPALPESAYLKCFVLRLD